MSIVLAEDRGAVRHVVLNRPEKRNALNDELIVALREALARRRRRPRRPLRRRARRRADVLVRDGLRRARRAGRRPGRPARVAPADPRDVEPARGDAQADDRADPRRAASAARWSSRWPATCASMAADAVIGLPETRIGLIPDVGGSSRLPAVVGLGRAKELIMTVELDRRHRGRAHRARQPRRGRRRARRGDRRARRRAAACAPVAVGHAKRVLDAAAKPALAATLEHEVTAQALCARHRGLRRGHARVRRAAPAGVQRPLGRNVAVAAGRSSPRDDPALVGADADPCARPRGPRRRSGHLRPSTTSRRVARDVHAACLRARRRRARTQHLEADRRPVVRQRAPRRARARPLHLRDHALASTAPWPAALPRTSVSRSALGDDLPLVGRHRRGPYTPRRVRPSPSPSSAPPAPWASASRCAGRAGVPIVIGSRDAEPRRRGRRARAASACPAAASTASPTPGGATRRGRRADRAVPHAVRDATRTSRSTLREGQLLVDATVPLAAAVSGKATRMLGVWQGSAAQQAQEMVPDGVRVVVARCTPSARARSPTSTTTLDEDVLVCGDRTRRQAARRRR